MLSDLSSYGSEDIGKMKQAERCWPDYEAMINRLRPRVDRAIAFRDAALDYCKHKTAKDGLAMLIGELVTECNQLESELYSLINEQEEASNKTKG